MVNALSQEPPIGGTQVYRLVVWALPSSKKQFIWEILDDVTYMRVQASEQTFRSLADAHKAGQGALEYWRGQAALAEAKALLVHQPRSKG